MNAEQLQAIKDRVDKATPGPWIIEESRFGSFNAASVDESYDLPACLMNNANAQFVTNAREDIPALVEEVKRLQNEKEALEFHLKVSINANEELNEELEVEVTENERLIKKAEQYDVIAHDRDTLTVENNRLRAALKLILEDEAPNCDGYETFIHATARQALAASKVDG